VKRKDLIFAFLALVILWQLLAMVVNRQILPSPVVVAITFWYEFSNGLIGHFLPAFGAS